MIPTGVVDRAGDRRALVRRALCARRLDLHRVVLRRREPRSVHVRARRAGAAVRSISIIPVVFSDSFPWSLLLIPAAIAWWRERRVGREPTRVPASGRCCGSGSSSSSASSRSRRGSRISTSSRSCRRLPLWPAWARALRQRRGPIAAASHRRPIGIATALLVLGVGARLPGRGRGRGVHDRRCCRLSGVIGVVAGARGRFGSGWRRRVFGGRGICWRWRSSPSTLSSCSGRSPSFEAYKPVPGFAETIAAARGASDDIVATYDQSMPSLVFYLRRHVDETRSMPTELVATCGVRGRRSSW